MTDMKQASNGGLQWSTALGVVLILAGIAAIAFPLFSTIAMKVLLGWIFLAVGIVQILNAFGSEKWGESIWHLLVAILFIVAGGWLAFFPLTGILPLTIFLAIVFIAEGVFKTMMAFRARPLEGWLLVLISGLIAIGVGLLIAMELPSSAIWTIGVLAGINLIFTGASYIALATSAR